MYFDRWSGAERLISNIYKYYISKYYKNINLMIDNKMKVV